MQVVRTMGQKWDKSEKTRKRAINRTGDEQKEGKN
jgi:hypothetical protein